MQQKLVRVVTQALRRCVHGDAGPRVDVSPVVREALDSGRPVVALESTIISHGMPYPENLQTALEVEEVVTKHGAVPATIAIIKGRVKVGVERDMLSELAMMKSPAVKTSRRDFPYVLSKGLNGGTTVSGTIVIANLVGIKVFATGGIGGVHRGGEESMDISADLTEMGRNPIAVVSSGVKSILDIHRTLEYLETQGVSVVTYGPSRQFPAFYSPHSGAEAPYNVDTPGEAAAMLHSLLELGLNSGLLLGVPIPQEHALSGVEVEEAIHKAVMTADTQGIRGKEVTPYILSKVNELTEGKSLVSNIALVKNNAKVAAQVAVELCKLQGSRSRVTPNTGRVTVASSPRDVVRDHKQPVVIGGCNMDCVMAIKDDAIKADGRTLLGAVTQAGGGVARNLADALARLGTSPLLVSAVGRDHFGNQLLRQSLAHLDQSGIAVLEGARTACYSPIMDCAGECHFGIGDMEIHDQITPQMVEKFADKIRRSPLVVMDGNIPSETIQYVLELCKDTGVPVWFEPTDLRKAAKPFGTELWKSLSFTSPNLKELRRMAKAIGVSSVLMEVPDTQLSAGEVLAESSTLARELAQYINTVLVTLGRLGVMVVRKGSAEDTLFQAGRLVSPKSDKVSARLYEPPSVATVVNVSGAGDCLAAGFAVAMLQGLPESRCAAVGMECACLALKTSSPVPEELVRPSDAAWARTAPYQSVL